VNLELDNRTSRSNLVLGQIRNQDPKLGMYRFQVHHMASEQ
jgi:hypothetical protein